MIKIIIPAKTGDVKYKNSKWNRPYWFSVAFVAGLSAYLILKYVVL